MLTSRQYLHSKQVGDKPTFIGEVLSKAVLTLTPLLLSPGLCYFLPLESICGLRNWGGGVLVGATVDPPF